MKKQAFYIAFLVIVTVLIIYSGMTGYTAMKENQAYDEAASDMESGVTEERIGSLHFNRLTRREQYVYDAILKAAEALDEYTEKMPLVVKEDELSNALEALLLDRPDLFFLNAAEFTLEDRSETVVEGKTEEEDETVIIPVFTDEKYTTLYMAYKKYEEDISTLKSRLRASLSKADARAKDITDPYLRAEIIHDYLTDICTKGDASLQSKNASDAYGALVEGEATSLGYALAFKLLWERYEDGICHTVSYQGVYFAVYLTDDGYFAADPYGNDLDGVVNGEALPGAVYHGLLNVGTTELEKIYRGISSSSVPHCASGKDYYTYSGSSAELESELDAVLRAKSEQCERSGRRYFDIRFTGDGGEDAIREAALRVGISVDVYSLESELDVYLIGLSSDDGEAETDETD